MTLDNVKVDVYPVGDNSKKLLAFARLTVDDWLVIKNVRVVQSKNGEFVSMPSVKDESAESGYSDVAYPNSKEARQALNELVLDVYHKTKGNS